MWVPLLFNRVLYWDDWAHYWIFWVGGLEKAIEMYMQVAHPGHVVPVPLFYYLGGEYCGILARSVAVACHFANAFLVYHILRRIFIVDSLAVWIAAIYMLSPCYYMRSYFIQFFFDFYLRVVFVVSIFDQLERDKKLHCRNSLLHNILRIRDPYVLGALTSPVRLLPSKGS